MPGVTVAICTRDRPGPLARALESIALQQQRPDEVLVVDNAPAGSGCAALLAQRFPHVRCVREEARGVGRARDRALHEARGEVVAFLDDDAVAHSGWLAGLAGALAGIRGAAACTGRVHALALDLPAQRLFEANGGFDRGPQRIVLPDDARRRLHGLPAPLIGWAVSIGSACSLAVVRDRALEAGGFDAVFGGSAAVPGGEDLDLLWRLLDAGHRLVYEPRARAWHEHRAELDALERQLAGHARGLAAMLTKAVLDARGAQRVPLAVFLGWRLLKPGARCLRALAGRDPLPLSMLLATWRASLAAPGAYLRMRRREQHVAPPPALEDAGGPA
jgi:glycosyltransferase involved in cell wall biosynthesis